MPMMVLKCESLQLVADLEVEDRGCQHEVDEL